MSYDGAGNTAHYLRETIGYATKYPIVFSCFFRLGLTGNQTLQVALPSGDGTGAQYSELAVISGRLCVRRRNGASLFDCLHGTALSTGVRYHGMGWIAANGAASVWLNAAGRVDDANTIAISAAIDRYYVGLLGRETAGVTQALIGNVAEAALWMGWTPADRDALAARLAAGRSPLAEAVHPLHYHRLRANAATEPDARGAELPGLTRNGFTFNADEPAVDNPPTGGAGGPKRHPGMGGGFTA